VAGFPCEHEIRPGGRVEAETIPSGLTATVLYRGDYAGLAAAYDEVQQWLPELLQPRRPLSGKTIGGVLIWLVSWVVLYLVYRDKPFETRKALTVALVLIGLGLLGTFPIFFQAFAPGE
jgi:hypothetical protein